MNNNTYVVFDEDYDAATLAKHLGHLTTNPVRPLEFLHPRFDHAVNVPLESKFDNELNINASALRGTQAELMLANVFGLTLTPLAGDTYTIESKTLRAAQTPAVREYMLQLLLLEASKKGYDLAGMLSSGEELYMFVGVKAMVPRRGQGSSSTTLNNPAPDSPAHMYVTAGASSQRPGQVDTVMDKNMSSLSPVDSFTKGERAFESQYVKLRQGRQGIQLSEAKIQVKRELVQQGAITSAGSNSASAGRDVEE